MPSSGKRIKKQHPLSRVVEQSPDIERDKPKQWITPMQSIEEFVD
jgi:hypothetical protein